MIRVITITRESGAGGGPISKMVADRLGWRLLDHELLTEVEEAAAASPRLLRGSADCTDPWLDRLIQCAATLGAGRFSRTTAAIRQNVIAQAASMGNCVVAGSSGRCILHGQDDVFHVFLYAPPHVRQDRIQRLTGRHYDMQSQIEESDQIRLGPIQEYFGVDWRTPDLYDLMVNTSRGHRAAAAAIFSAAGLREAVSAQCNAAEGG